uniref:Uncharacterized protein n=1 Tax=Caenorhabditis japonica TaxID=281687 RepID=A0A8R1EWB5_CAEJA
KPEINTLKTNNNPYSTGSRKDRKRDRLTPPSSSSSSASSEACVTPPPSKRPTSSLSPVFSPAPFTPDFNMLQAYFLSQYAFPMGFPNPYFSSPFMMPTPTPTPPKIVEEEEELVVVDV